ncbi:MAG: YbaB/EbfC family nucleoid-associated protein [bacterium]
MDMQKMLQQAQQMQKKLQEAQDDFADETFTGQAGGGVVSVTINGNGEVESLSLEDEVVDPDEIDMLEDLIVSAIQSAHDDMEEAKEEQMGDMGLPGGGDMGGLGDMLG